MAAPQETSREEDFLKCLGTGVFWFDKRETLHHIALAPHKVVESCQTLTMPSQMCSVTSQMKQRQASVSIPGLPGPWTKKCLTVASVCIALSRQRAPLPRDATKGEGASPAQ